MTSYNPKEYTECTYTAHSLLIKHSTTAGNDTDY